MKSVTYLRSLCYIIITLFVYSGLISTNTFRNEETNNIPVICSDKRHAHKSSARSPFSFKKGVIDDPLCLSIKSPGNNSICYLGHWFCKPGFHGSTCNDRKNNPWYVRNCPNLKMDNTLDISLPLSQVGGEHDPNYSSFIEPKYCAYLCYSHYIYGTAIVPKSLWLAAQKGEGDLWKEVSQWSTSSDSNDRAIEHWKAYSMFNFLEKNRELGHVIEVGAGPWTQLKAILYIRPDLHVNHFTVWEPGANRYIKEVSSCSYKERNKLMRWDTSEDELYHSFPVTVQSDGGELLTRSQPSNMKQYDTLISINVLEHVQDAFSYMTGLYLSLRKGGLLILHERYYNDRTVLDGDKYHPIRIKRVVLDFFLEGFEIIFNNCSAHYEGRRGEKGYYVVATKL